jgi:hypothetical protein
MAKHTFQENYEKIFGSIEEGWWDNMGDAGQKAYIKKHGKAPGSAGGDDKGDEDDYDMGVVPGSREEWEDIEPGDPEMRSGDESAEELGDLMKQQQNHIEDMFEKGADREDIEAAEGNLEDLEREYDEKVESGEGEDDEDEYPDKDPINTKKGEMEDEMEDIANELDNVTDPDEKKELEDRYDKIDQELYDINKKQYGDDSGYEKSGRTGNESVDEGWFDSISQAAQKAYIQKFPNSKFAKNTKKKADDKKGKESAHQKELDTISKDIKNLKGAVDHTQDKGDWAANRDWRDKLEKSQKQWMKLKGQGPDESINEGDFAANETLTIDGKQFRRISEVEQKPKYEFAEFYKRFKR